MTHGVDCALREFSCKTPLLVYREGTVGCSLLPVSLVREPLCPLGRTVCSAKTILECEIMWALGNIIMKKASGGYGIPVELFQILKDDAVKVLHSMC